MTETYDGDPVSKDFEAKVFRALADGSKQVSKKRFDHSFKKFWKPFRKNALEKRKTLFLERKTLLAKELAGLA